MDGKNKKAKNRRRIIDNEYENDTAKNTENSEWMQKILLDSTIFQKFVY